MKMKKYLILVVVSLIAIEGTAIGTDETQKPSGDKKKSRLRFLEGVFRAQSTQMLHRTLPPGMKQTFVKAKFKKLRSDIKLNRKPELDGIQGVVVKVENLPKTERYGLTRQALQTDTELRLRQYGIKVITEEEYKSNDKELREERIIDIAKHGAYTHKLIDLLDSGQYEKAFKQMKEPEKSLIESLLNEESEERFLHSVMVYIIKQEEYYKSSYSVAGPPTLYINVLPLIFEQQVTAVAYVSVELHRHILLTRGASAFFAKAVLWKRGFIISRILDDIGEIRDEVRDKVDEFINDYLAANPTKKTTVSPSTTKAPQKGLISAIVVSEDNPSAVINDTIVHEGDTVDGVTVVKIYEDRVVFEKEGTEPTIRWTQKIGSSKRGGISSKSSEKGPQGSVGLSAAVGRWQVFETTTIDGWVKKVKRGTIFKTTSGNIYEVVDVVILIEMEMRPDVTVLTDGRFYKLFIRGVDEPLLCRKLNRGKKGITSSQAIIEARVTNDFDGFEDGNIYKLDNGQVWEQIDTYVWIHVAVMPRVTIWRDGPVYKMKVDGIGRAVTVKQIN